MSSVKNTQIDGDVSVGRNVTAGGNASIEGSGHIKGGLVVEGWLDAPNMKKDALGLFATEEILYEHYPDPRPGQFAYVGKTLPANLYVEEKGKWKDTGTQGGSPELVDYNYAELETKLEKEISDRQTADTEHKNLISGEQSVVTNNIRNAFIYLGNFATWNEAKAELDKLHSQGADNTKIGNFRILLNGRNIEVNSWVQNWATGVFTQTVRGSIQWNDESQTMDQSLNINTYERRYNEGAGWTAWVKNVKDISEATEDNSGLMSEDDKKKINSLPLTFTFLQYDEIVDGEGIYFTNATYTFEALTGRYKLKAGSDESKVIIPMAGTTQPGIMSVADKKKLDSLKPLTYIDHGTSNTSANISAFEYHRWGEVSQILVNVPNKPTTDEGVVNVYMLEFKSGSTPTKIAWQQHIKPSTNTIEANKTYQITIINNLATVKSFE